MNEWTEYEAREERARWQAEAAKENKARARLEKNGARDRRAAGQVGGSVKDWTVV